jgi:hypothetical protein
MGRGLYWVTVLAEKQSPGVSELAATATDSVEVRAVGPSHSLVKAFRHPNEWRLYAQAIDDWCLKQPGVFSLARIRAELEDAPNFQTLRAITARWK